jgi:hypothetical protein
VAVRCFRAAIGSSSGHPGPSRTAFTKNAPEPKCATYRQSNDGRKSCLSAYITANNKLVGTPRADLIRGYAGHDEIYGRGSDDELMGERGNDYIHSMDKLEDDISCGPGNDVAKANP